MRRSIVALTLLAVSMPLSLSAAGAAPAASGCTGTQSATRLWVNIDRVRPGGGLIAVSLYKDDRKKFLAKRGALYVGRVPAAAPRTRMCIHLPSTGVWGLAVYHDADADRAFDRNNLGLPAEGYGFSNNPATLFGLPSFSSVRLNIPRNNMETTVRLTYPR